MKIGEAAKAHPYRMLALLASFVVVLSVGLWLYDQSRSDVVASGVTVGGIDIGGLDAAEAEARLESRLLPVLRTPLRVDHGDRRWILGPEEARITADLPASVDEAVRASRGGSVLTRTWRAVTGGDLDVDLTPEISYSDAAIVRLIDRVRKEVDRKAIDAAVKLDLDGPTVQEGRPGLEVDASGLHERMRAAIGSATLPRRLSAQTRKTQPKVTTAQAKTGYDTALVVNRNRFKLTLYKKLEKVKTYDIAVGAVGLETPAGTYSIQNKAVNPAWTKPNSSWVPEDERGEVVPGGTAANPLKARWLGIFDGAGIHGIDPSAYGTIGTAASHGCVRMRIPDVIDLYDRVPVGAPIYIG